MKKILLVISVIALLVSLVLFVNAHPGRTDGAGCHTNRSTGEYHFHHGYSEHNHYDMDGDGNVDCPYDFKDETNHSSSDNSKSKEERQPTTQKSTDYSKTQKESKQIDSDLVPWIVAAIILILSWVLFILYCSLV